MFIGCSTSLPFSFCFSAARRQEPSRAQIQLAAGVMARPRFANAAPPKNKKKMLGALRAINIAPLTGLRAPRPGASLKPKSLGQGLQPGVNETIQSAKTGMRPHCRNSERSIDIRNQVSTLLVALRDERGACLTHSKPWLKKTII